MRLSFQETHIKERYMTDYIFKAIDFPDRYPQEVNGQLVGYAAIIMEHKLQVVAPAKLCIISKKNKRYSTDQWEIFTPRYEVEKKLSAHLTFALRYQGIDLALLNALFQIEGIELVLHEWITSEPTGKYSRRIWFLFEWLTDKVLDIPDVKTGNFVDLLDPKNFITGPSSPSKRQRVRNNLLGNIDYCPMVRRTPIIEAYLSQDMKSEAAKVIGKIHKDVIARAAAFMMLSDSKASFAIEGETPPRGRAERWGQALGQAGKTDLTIKELERLQHVVIPDARFIDMGLREKAGFVGTHARDGTPIPDHISARHEDLDSLMTGLFCLNERLAGSDINPVIMATLVAFGFVFIHPFEDGNGRLHRFLIHHVLAKTGFSDAGVLFPVSAVILERINDYRTVLEAYSTPRLSLIDWIPTSDGNVDVRNGTLDLYRFFDATPQVEFLFECVDKTIKVNLPEEIAYLQSHDQMKAELVELYDIPDHKLDLLISVIHQNGGTLSATKRKKLYSAFTDAEVEKLSDLYNEAFRE